ncbi:MAG: hypothetical protein LBI84_04155, partial [Propionibacteriaceae bacterium]|nr:hypothetical protein [Propionibacteriaceae bacterium]
MRNLCRRRSASEPARTRTIAALAAGFDVILALGMLAAGARLASPWLVANAAYYAALGVVRGYLLRHLSAAPGGIG